VCVSANADLSAVKQHDERMARIARLLQQVEAEQREMLEIVGRIERLRTEIANELLTDDTRRRKTTRKRR
jgi:hypothetical protein